MQVIKFYEDIPAGKTLSVWKVKYMAKNMEPPYPFGKTYVYVEAYSRTHAIERVERLWCVSPHYKITASKLT